MGNTRLKYCLAMPLQYGANESGVPYEETLPRYIRITDINSDNSLKDDEVLSLPLDIATPYILQDGDILFARSGGTVGKTFFYERKYGLCAFAGYLIKARANSKVALSKFIYYFTLGSGYDEWKSSVFFRATIQNIGADKYANLIIPTPSIAEQTATVAYLDRRTVEIDTLLADLQAQADMLERYKREFITNTVTHGMDKSAIRKNSGVDWIGAIPETWEILPLFAAAEENKVKNDGMVCDNLLSLSYGKIITKDMESNFGLLPASFEGYQVVHPGYTVMRLTDLQNDKRSLRTGYVEETGIITSAYLGLIPSERLDGKYFNYLLHAYDLLKIYYGLGSGLRQTLKFSDMKWLPVLIPPMSEQRAIVAHIDIKTAQINGLITNINEQIEKLKQYRQIVIHDAVTGKIKVTEG